MRSRIKTLAAATLMIAAATAVTAQTTIHVGKSRGCGFYLAWMEKMSAVGFAPEGENMGGELIRLKMDRGIPVDMFSCLTATVEGYTIEGHVPPAGMPIGSPGMDFGDDAEAYDVFLVKSNGSIESYSSYPAS